MNVATACAIALHALAATPAVAERARKAGATETRFVNQYGSYTLKLDFMVQVNTHTGTTRPVRYVS